MIANVNKHDSTRSRKYAAAYPIGIGDLCSRSNPSKSLWQPSGDAVPQSAQAIKEERTQVALADLKVLLAKKIDQEKKYGLSFDVHSNFYMRHIMVCQFLEMQLASHVVGSRCQRTLLVAQGFSKGYLLGGRIVQWERSWVQERMIPQRSQGGGRTSWMDNENIIKSVRHFAKKQGDSKFQP